MRKECSAAANSDASFRAQPSAVGVAGTLWTELAIAWVAGTADRARGQAIVDPFAVACLGPAMAQAMAEHGRDQR